MLPMVAVADGDFGRNRAVWTNLLGEKAADVWSVLTLGEEPERGRPPDSIPAAADLKLGVRTAHVSLHRQVRDAELGGCAPALPLQSNGEFGPAQFP